MRGPSGSVFDPPEYIIDTKIDGNSCDDLTFKLKGFSLTFGIKALNQEGKLIQGPENTEITLTRKKAAKFDEKRKTDSVG